MFKTILVAVDGSDQSRDALATACDLAKTYKAKLHIIHAPQFVSETIAIGYSAVPIPPTNEDIVEAGKEIIGDAVEQAAKQGVSDPVTQVGHGDPARVIVEYAKSHDVDMIVMGRRGLGSFSAVLVGSVTNKVAHHADCAVLTVK